MDFLLPPLSRRGRYVQLTSRGEPSINSRWLPADLRDWSEKCRLLRPGQVHEAAHVSGAGVITRLFVAFPAFWHPQLYREILLRITWDKEEHPSVEVPVGDFFGIHHCKYRQYDSRLFSLISGGMVCHALMPFSKGFRLSFEQQGSVSAPLFFYGIGYYEADINDVSPLRFCASWRHESMTECGVPFTFLDVKGCGYYVGLSLSTQNRDLWMLANPLKRGVPRGLGLGHLEGEEEIWVDDETESRHRGTGHEEYFNTGWYFAYGRYTGRDSGCLHRSYLSGRTGSYRWHWRDPLPFRRNIRGVMHHGIRDMIPSDYSATAYWYQEKPVNSLPVMQAVNERRLTPVWKKHKY